MSTTQELLAAKAEIERLRPKAEAWDRISEAWVEYCEQGPGEFDWDYDSRDVMKQLTNQPVVWWYRR